MSRPIAQPRSRRTALTLFIALTLAGCIDGFEPELGQQLVERCRDRDSDPKTDISFEDDIRKPIFEDKMTCLPCHDPTGKDPRGWQLGGLDLRTFDSLMAGGVNSAADIVVPGKPCSSRLLQKVGAAPPSGSRMPLTGNPLTAAQVQAIHDWIFEGARDN